MAITQDGFDKAGNLTSPTDSTDMMGPPTPTAAQAQNSATGSYTYHQYPFDKKGESAADERLNRHYMKFFVNIDEESSMVKELNGSYDLGFVDNTEQNRLNRGLATAEVFQTAGGVVGAALAAKVAAQAANNTKIFSSMKGKASAATAAGVAGAAAAAAGFFAGRQLAGIAVNELKLTKKLKRLAHAIKLYMPAGISSSYNLRWEVTEDQLVNLAQSDNMDAVKKALSSPGDAGANLSKVARILAASSSTASILSRTALNPKKDVLFKSVDNRSFTFDYQFAPRSEEEAQEVDQIIYLFKLYAHPEMLDGYGQFLFIYPAEFEIEFWFIDQNGTHKRNPYMPKISACVLESVRVSYSNNGSFQSLPNGEPVVTNLTLNFKEIETLHQDRIRKGY